MKKSEDVNGGKIEPISKPMDRPFPSYLNNETDPQDDFNEEPLDEGLMDNPGDLSTRFV